MKQVGKQKTYSLYYHLWHYLITDTDEHISKEKDTHRLRKQTMLSKRKGGGKLRNEDQRHYTYTNTYYIHVSKRPNIQQGRSTEHCNIVHGKRICTFIDIHNVQMNQIVYTQDKQYSKLYPDLKKSKNQEEVMRHKLMGIAPGKFHSNLQTSTMTSRKALLPQYPDWEMEK